jgi:acyl-CoA reductase-like NAD-dependent aldehyde dehydrogenase
LCAALEGESFEVENPADMSVVGHAPRCREPDVRRAVAAAERAFPAWSKTPALARGRLIARAADLIEARADTIAALLSLETGNAYSTQARPELNATLDMMRLFAGLASELKGRNVPWTPGTLHYTTRDPLGVVAAIIPWNAPVYLMACKLGPALVAGNTLVMKTAEQAPLAVLACAEILQEVLPAGVFNVISGYGEECGKPLAEHPQVRKVTFTGSCPVGKIITAYAAPKLCPVTLELGGKSPNVVMADADLALAVPGIVQGMRFTRQGQSCTAGSRVFLQEEIYERVVGQVVERMQRLRLGDPLDARTEVGTIISQEQFDRVQSYVDMAKATPGVRIRCGGGRPADPALQKGLFFSPTLIDGIPNDSKVCRDEIFGPVANVLPFRDFEQMMAQANDTDYGLAAAIWTRDLSRALEFAERIQAGFVQVNQYDAPKAAVAYGGLKMSGVGKEGTLESMLEHFTASKTVIVNRGTPAA